MKIILRSNAVLFSVLLMSCGGKEEKRKDGFSLDRAKSKTEQAVAKTENKSTVKASETIDLTNKGVGPIKSVSLGAEIDTDMAKQGEEVFKQMCMACHRVGKKFIGPAPDGILKRRTPEWVMNMILNPDGMVKEDPLAKELLQEFNGSPMANQGLTEDQARAVVEYFRTL
ncbi:cytochrome c [Arenibacter sp. 6A1]|uniref:c-type cytochrome n=1 Tax=Arenibacter sp. 6A1 TaxID=2720391 RepID=UPI001445BB65|nr:cytochrome c [Arenibacter sp. 6A1]NKI27036.1 cytochrome c [Arenibacter sp. 6A1]